MSGCQKPPMLPLLDVLDSLRKARPGKRRTAQRARSTTREPVTLTPDRAASLTRGYLVAEEPSCPSCVEGFIPRADGGIDRCGCYWVSQAAMKLRAARIPSDMLAAFETPDETKGRAVAIDRLRLMIEGARTGNILPDGIMMTGDTRIGKSLLAAFVGIQFVSVGRSVRWASIDLIDESVKDKSYGQNMPIGSVLREFIDAELLIIDEVKQRSEHAQRIIGRVIRARFETRRPTILTSNGTEEEVKTVFERHIWARLVEFSPVIHVTGRRRAST